MPHLAGSISRLATFAAALDRADVSNAALAALRHGGTTRLHLIDLATSRATPIGGVADGQALVGLAFEP